MRLLLDGHLSRALAEALNRHGFDAIILADWLGGSHRNSIDERILVDAYADNRILLTFDTHTVPDLLVRLAEEGRHHAGVILVSWHSARPDQIGRLLAALRTLKTEAADWEWLDRMYFLRVR